MISESWGENAASTTLLPPVSSDNISTSLVALKSVLSSANSMLKRDVAERVLTKTGLVPRFRGEFDAFGVEIWRIGVSNLDAACPGA
jgi:hypothetical protein